MAYLLSLSSKATMFLLMCKAAEKLTRDYFYSSDATVVNPLSTASPVATTPVVVPDRVSSTENAPVTVETQEEVGLEDYNKDDGEEDDDDSKEDNVERDSLVREVRPRKIVNPRRSNGADCSFNLRTRTSRDGANCRSNHPARKENQSFVSAQRSDSPESSEVIKEKEKERFSERKGQQECKYYLRPGGCKFGNACRYSHSRKKPLLPPPLSEPPLDFNFLDLPIRPGESECPEYMRDGFCKFGRNCRFHHPDPTAVEEDYIPSGSVSLHPSCVLQSASTSWSYPPNETVPDLDAQYASMTLPLQGLHPNPKSGYQAKANNGEGPELLRSAHDGGIAIGGGDIPYNSASLHLSGASQPAPTSWSYPSNEIVSNLDASNPYASMALPPQGLHPNPKWDGYQAKANYGERPELLRSARDESIVVGGIDIPLGSVSLHLLGASQPASTSWSSPPNETFPFVDAPNPYVPIMMHPNHGWNGYQANLKHNGIQPLLAENPNFSGWSMPKTHPALNGTCRKGAKKTKIVHSLWCEICKISCPNKDGLDQHKLGKKHKNNMEKLEESKKEASTPAATVAPAAKGPVIGPKESPGVAEGKTVVQSARCEMCKIDCSSKDVLVQPEESRKEASVPAATVAPAAKGHMLGPRESPAADKGNTVVQSSRHEICKIGCSSKDVSDQHKLENKHKKNLKKLKESKKEVSAPAATAAPAAMDPLIGPKESSAADEGKTVVQSVWCEICKIKCTRTSDFEHHKAGKKHKSNMEKLEESKKEASAPAATVVTAAKDSVIGPKESPSADKRNTVVESARREIRMIDCNKDALDQHNLVKMHKNQEKLEEPEKEASSPAANDPPIGPKESPAANNSMTVGVQQPKKNGASPLGPREDLETRRRKLIEGGVAADSVKVCIICDVVCNSQVVFINHLRGQKHANMVKKLAAAVGTVNPSGPEGGNCCLEDELP
ncbi:zinc finger RNA-binding protein 2-like isoform X7 [Macadamia integrifolia]|uniref:zinc finger RNA-binding protein 2-like isoform X7 n=1 Tax=Macadamia integrifolia TaxID=60698 RepID=UPI001C4E6002|nr:zinc finger RNA-binding protein 2-like isoform X7 [Macadamia integrifolia]